MILLMTFFVYIGSILSGYESPQKISVRRLGDNWPTDFSVEDELEEGPAPLAKVETHFFGNFREYSLYSQGKKLIANAKHSFHYTCALFTIETAAKERIATIEEHENYFHIYDEKNSLLATSKMNYWETEIVILAPHGHPLAKLTRPYFREHDGWNLFLLDPCEWQLHRALWLLLPAIQTDLPYWSKFPYYHSQKGDLTLRPV